MPRKYCNTLPYPGLRQAACETPTRTNVTINNLPIPPALSDPRTGEFIREDGDVHPNAQSGPHRSHLKDHEATVIADRRLDDAWLHHQREATRHYQQREAERIGDFWRQQQDIQRITSSLLSSLDSPSSSSSSSSSSMTSSHVSVEVGTPTFAPTSDQLGSTQGHGGRHLLFTDEGTSEPSTSTSATDIDGLNGFNGFNPCAATMDAAPSRPTTVLRYHLFATVANATARAWLGHRSGAPAEAPAVLAAALRGWLKHGVEAKDVRVRWQLAQYQQPSEAEVERDTDKPHEMGNVDVWVSATGVTSVTFCTCRVLK